jgi:hypothetical protein
MQVDNINTSNKTILADLSCRGARAWFWVGGTVFLHVLGTVIFRISLDLR